MCLEVKVRILDIIPEGFEISHTRSLFQMTITQPDF